jgi:hypothetical protein
VVCEHDWDALRIFKLHSRSRCLTFCYFIKLEIIQELDHLIIMKVRWHIQKPPNQFIFFRHKLKVTEYSCKSQCLFSQNCTNPTKSSHSPASYQKWIYSPSEYSQRTLRLLITPILHIPQSPHPFLLQPTSDFEWEENIIPHCKCFDLANPRYKRGLARSLCIKRR